MIDKLRPIFVRLVMGMLALLCVLCTYLSFFRTSLGNITIDTFHPSVLLLGTVVYIGVLLAARYFIQQCPERWLKRLVVLLFVAYALGLAFAGLSLRGIAPFDLKDLYIEAINMQGTSQVTNSNYFSIYPFQQSLAILLYYLFKLSSAVGITDFRAAGILFNVCMIWLSAFFLYRIVLEEKGFRPAVGADCVLRAAPLLQDG